MDLKLDEKAICTACKKDKRHVGICCMKDKSFRDVLDIEFSVCGICGKGYCSLRADVVDRECEHCAHKVYNNVKEDGTLEQRLVWKKKQVKQN